MSKVSTGARLRNLGIGVSLGIVAAVVMIGACFMSAVGKAKDAGEGVVELLGIAVVRAEETAEGQSATLDVGSGLVFALCLVVGVGGALLLSRSSRA